MFTNKLALVIPTRNRPDTLIKLLKSIQIQNVRPDQVIIVDGSDAPIYNQIKEYLATPADKYVHVTNPSLTKQKNEGIRQLRDDITIAGFLDDDTELELGAIEEMLLFWERMPTNTGGASFNIVNAGELNRFSRLIRKFFLIHDGSSGRILKSGCCTSALPASSDVYVQWLCGGATVWRREVLESYKFDEWYSGWACHEDVDYSYRILKKYDLYVVYKAKILHNPPPVIIDKNKAFGKMLVINRYYFVSKNPELSIPAFYWATFGDVVLNILKSMWEKNLDGFHLAQGNLSGLYHVLTGNIVQVNENFRE